MIAIDDSQQILLVKNSYEPGWGLPGGFLKRNEEPTLGAIREIHEETGYEIRLADLKLHGAVLEGRRANVTFVYSCRLKSDLGLRVATFSSFEILRSDWMPLSDLPGLKRGTELLLEAAGIFTHALDK